MYGARFMSKKIPLSLLVLGISWTSFSMENTKVLPKGVRSLNFKNAVTNIDSKTNAVGNPLALAEPLTKEFTFRKVINNETGVNRMLLQSFLEGKFEDTDSLGVFTADMKGSVAVLAGVVSYGVTERLTLGVGIPYYRARMNVNMGFKASKNALKFINLLNDPSNNQSSKAREVAGKIQNAVGELNNKLSDNGYEPIQDWNGSGLGDITGLAKYRFLDSESFKMAHAIGFTAPTGFAGDPNIPINVPFGTGTWSILNVTYLDEYITHDWWLNQYFKYIYQIPASKNVRLKTEDETITVAEDRIRYKLANRWETGVSTQYEPWFGLVFGTGFSYTGKTGDRYYTDDQNAKFTLEKDTNDWSTYWETRVGYQTLPAFLRKEFPVPLVATLEMKKHLKSVNTPVKDLYTFDLYVFF